MIIGVSGKMQSGKNLTANIIQYLVDKKKMNYTTEDTKEDLESYLKNKHNLKCEWQQKAFADKLKDIVCLLIGCTREQLEDNTFKNTELGEEWWYYKNIGIGKINKNFAVKSTKIYSTIKEAVKNRKDEENLDYDIEIIKPTPRLLLQLLGTDCGRDIIHTNIWVNSLMSEYKILYYFETGNNDEECKASRTPIHPNWIITDLRFPNELQAIKDRGGITIRVQRFEQISENVRVHGTGVPHPSETVLDNEEFDYVIDNNSDINSLIEKVKVVLKHSKII
jgi:hypothetical protein